MFRITKKRTAILGLVASLVVAAAAVAYFSSTGSGSGTATVGTSKGFVVKDTSTPVTLYPGTGSFAVTGTVNNPGAANQALGTSTVTINAPTVSSTAPAGDPSHACSAADYTLTASSGSGWTVAADGDSATYSYTAGHELNNASTEAFPTGLSISMVDRGYNQDNCQGATVNWTDLSKS